MILRQFQKIQLFNKICTMSQQEFLQLDASKSVIYVLTWVPSVPELLAKRLPSSVTLKPLQFEGRFNFQYKLTKSQMDFVREAEIILCDNSILAQNLGCFPKLKWAHCSWAGVENIVKSVAENKIKSQFLLTRHGGSDFSRLMAEYVLCQILNWERSMKIHWKNQESKHWEKGVRFFDTRTISALNICILGTGNMAKGVAKYLKMLGAVVVGLSRTEKNMSSDEYCSFDQISTDLAQVLSECDYICNTLPHTVVTDNLLGDDKLKYCKNRPVFINVGRGSIIKEEQLVHALRNEWISGAILDVFKQEPLPESSPLWTMPQVMITPHVSARSEANHIVDFFLQNFENYVAGKELKQQVNWSEGY